MRAIEQIRFDLQLLKVSPSGEKVFRENRAAKICMVREQTPPTNTVNWVLRLLNQSALGKYTSISLLVKFTRVIFNQPYSDSQCAQRGENFFFAARFCHEAVGAKWGRQQRELPLESKLKRL